MKAKAPGKVVISGAYAVLHGAPALVSAVDRYVIADTAVEPAFVTPEARAGMSPPFPDFDASQLREHGRKLGLGSSAAILVASVVAAEYPNLKSDSGVLNSIFHRCLKAHREAQGGGSGIDVAASVFGGTLEYQLPESGLLGPPPRVTQRTLPNLVFQLWASDRAASTAEFLARIAGFRAQAPNRHEQLMGALVLAAEQARNACVAAEAEAFLSALGAQATGLAALGAAAGIPIVIPELAELQMLAQSEGAVVLPAGAGGGDIALFVGRAQPSEALLQLCAERSHRPIRVVFGAPGVHPIPSTQ